MNVYFTPWAAKAMTDEERDLIAQESFGDSGSTLSLLAKSATGPFIARLYHPDLGEIRTTGATLAEAIRDAIVRLHA